MYPGPYCQTPGGRGINNVAPKVRKAPTFTFRQRGVLGKGFEMTRPVTVPVVKTWKLCQRIIQLNPAGSGEAQR